MLKPDIVICLSGGVVQAVYAHDLDLSVAVVDWDAYPEDADLPGVVLIERNGQQQAAFVGKLDSDPMTSLAGSDAEQAIQSLGQKNHAERS